MSITRSPSPAYFAPVTHKYLDDDGKLQSLEFDARFKRLKASEVRLIFVGPVEDRPKDDQVIERYLLGWRTAEPYDGGAVEATCTPPKELLLPLCEEYVGLSTSIALSWWQSISADKPAHYAAKN